MDNKHVDNKYTKYVTESNLKQKISWSCFCFLAILEVLYGHFGGKFGGVLGEYFGVWGGAFLGLYWGILWGRVCQF